MRSLPEISKKSPLDNFIGEEWVGEDMEYSFEEFQNLVEVGGFVDYDGFGEWVKDDGSFTGVFVNPSQLSNTEVPEGATRIRWYNR